MSKWFVWMKFLTVHTTDHSGCWLVVFDSLGHYVKVLSP